MNYSFADNPEMAVREQSERQKKEYTIQRELLHQKMQRLIRRPAYFLAFEYHLFR